MNLLPEPLLTAVYARFSERIGDIMIAKKTTQVQQKTKRKKNGHTKPKAPTISLDQPGRLRVSNMMAILCVGHSTFVNGVKTGRYPPADGRDGNFQFWYTSTGKKRLNGGAK